MLRNNGQVPNATARSAGAAHLGNEFACFPETSLTESVNTDKYRQLLRRAGLAGSAFTAYSLAFTEYSFEDFFDDSLFFIAEVDDGTLYAVFDGPQF